MKIGYIIGTYPLLTTTFIDREIQGLRKHGIRILILSVRRPFPESGLAEQPSDLPDRISYLIPVKWIAFILSNVYFLMLRPREYVSLGAYLISRKHPTLALRVKTLLHFWEGVYAAFLFRSEACDRFHAHFADRAAIVAMCVSRLLGKPYSLTAHANDLYASPMLLSEKIANAQFTITVSKFNKEHILRQHPELDAGRIIVLHPWVDLDEFQPPASRSQHGRFVILSVGRLVEKKGHPYLVQACRLLRERGLNFECRIVGGGPLEQSLRALIAELDLQDTVLLEGAKPAKYVMELLSRGDVFVLASIVADDGDRDGMPVALAEAMAMQVPVISTDIVGISELVQPGAGRLVPPRNPEALAEAITSVYSADPETRAVMGQRGRAIVEQEFDVRRGIDCLAELFQDSGKSMPYPRPSQQGGNVRQKDAAGLVPASLREKDAPWL